MAGPDLPGLHCPAGLRGLRGERWGVPGGRLQEISSDGQITGGHHSDRGQRQAPLDGGGHQAH